MLDHFSIEFGHQIGMLFSARSEFYGLDINLSDSVQLIDFGLNFGMRYLLGLSSIQPGSNTSKIRNVVFQPFIGFFF